METSCLFDLNEEPVTEEENHTDQPMTLFPNLEVCIYLKEWGTHARYEEENETP